MNAQMVDTSTHTRLSGPRLVAARLGWLAIVGLTVGVFAAFMPIFFNQMAAGGGFGDALRQMGIPPLGYAIYLSGIAVVQFAIYAAVGLLLFWRRSDDWMAAFVSVVLFTFGGYSSVLFTLSFDPVPALLRSLVFIVLGIGQALFVAFLYIFPDGKFYPRWVRWPVYAWVIWSLLAGFFPGAPFSIFHWPLVTSFMVSLAAYTGSVVIQGVRLAHYYTAAQKQQTKWIIFGLLLCLLGGYILLFWPRLMFPTLNGSGGPALMYDMASHLIAALSLITFPIGIAFSVLRYRLWDVDFLINRSIVYGALTACLILLFVAGFGAIQMLFRHLNMTEGEHAGVALAVSGVVFGLLFAPARKRLQKLVDRRLYGIRISYDQPAAPPAGAAPGVITVGTKLGVYQVTETLGRGGMAEVYKGQHSTLGREVAIKTLPAAAAQDPEFRKRFEREARTIGALSHPNIVRLYDFGEVAGTYYMVMEYVQGGSLSGRMQQIGALPLAEARRLVGEIGGALDYAHGQGIVHRDVKPSNVMLQQQDGDWRPVLTDFGIARIMGGGTRITRTGIVGTFDYMAPEQIRDAQDVDGRADIYSLGVMLFQMLTGRLPFEAGHPAALLIAHLNQPAPNPRDLRPDIPELVADATLRALEKDPARRFQTAGELAAALA